MKREPKTPTLSSRYDGFSRTPAQEKDLNLAFASVFRGADGKIVLDYLKSISIQNVSGPNVDTNSLLHLEGQRFLVGIIAQRFEAGLEKKA